MYFSIFGFQIENWNPDSELFRKTKLESKYCSKHKSDTIFEIYVKNREPL